MSDLNGAMSMWPIIEKENGIRSSCSCLCRERERRANKGNGKKTILFVECHIWLIASKRGGWHQAERFEINDIVKAMQQKLPEITFGTHFVMGIMWNMDANLRVNSIKVPVVSHRPRFNWCYAPSSIESRTDFHRVDCNRMKLESSIERNRLLSIWCQITGQSFHQTYEA